MERHAVQNLRDLHKDLAVHRGGQSFGKNIHTTLSPGPRASASAVASMRNRLQAVRLQRAEFLGRERSNRGWRFPWTLAARPVRRRRTQEAVCPTHSSVFAK